MLYRHSITTARVFQEIREIFHQASKVHRYKRRRDTDPVSISPLPSLRDALKLSRTAWEYNISTGILDVDEAAVLKPNLVVWDDAAGPQA
jgi:hypothetical protein